MSSTPRWLQRLANLNNAHARLAEACRRDQYSDLELAGLVHTCHLAFELCWKTMQDKLRHDGVDTNSPRDTLRQAFAAGLISDAEGWIAALDSRNLLTHVYDESNAEQAVDHIRGVYEPLIGQAVETLNALAAEP